MADLGRRGMLQALAALPLLAGATQLGRKPGDRVAWLRGPSGAFVLGTIVKECSPDTWASRRFAGREKDDHEILQRIWVCTEERVTDDWPYSRGAQWHVPECDFFAGTVEGWS